jgi:oxygen-independent coproporphyrinogen-3 oxidase
VDEFAAAAAAQGPQVGGAWMPRESADDRLLDTIMLRLRLGDGLHLGQLAAGHPQGGEAADRVLAALRPHIARGWVLADSGGGSSEEGSSASGGSSSSSGGGGSVRTGGGSSPSSVQHVRLADPDGFVISNDIISDCFAAFDLTEE